MLRTIFRLLLLLVSLSAFSPALLASQGQTISERVYRALDQAKKQMEEEQHQTAIDTLNGLNPDRLSYFEKANVLQLRGNIYLIQNQHQLALEDFNEAYLLDALEYKGQAALLNIMAKINLSLEYWQPAVDAMQAWLVIAEANQLPIQASNYVVLAQAYYQLQIRMQAIRYIDQAIALKQTQLQPGEHIPESWWLLKLSAHDQLKQIPEAIKVLKTLLSYAPKMRYWEYLAGYYQQQEKYVLALSALKSAKAQGLLKNEKHLKWLAQLYSQQSAPQRSAELLEQSMIDNQLKANATHWHLIGQYWSLAKETEKAIHAYQQAMNLDPKNEKAKKDLFRAYYSQQQWSEMLPLYANQEIENLKDSQLTYLVAMANYQIGNHQAAKKLFLQIPKTSAQHDHANYWLQRIN